MTGATVSGRLRYGPGVDGFAAEIGAEGPVAVEGGRTRWGRGGPATGEPRLVRAPAGLVEYRPDEMVARVGAATMVADLHDALAEQGQRTALPERGGTVGGAVAVGENDRDVLARGAVRNAVLQVTYVSADGRIVCGGGPTVKNVSGFDLPQLMVGSLGTLGCVAEVILRTNPIPAASRWYATAIDPFELFDLLLDPSAVLWDGETTWIHLEGHAPDVEMELARARTLGDVDPVDRPPSEPGTHRWSLEPGLLRGVGELVDGRPFLASVGVGTAWTVVPQPSRPLAGAAEEIHKRMKSFFDPTGRLNPGRDPARI